MSRVGVFIFLHFGTFLFLYLCHKNTTFMCYWFCVIIKS
uniref:Uncharacterized protein n=1 Tax=Rhizophora mucronata TaxID=61149 RepID=A0A2P2PSS1_RHIMU